MRTIKTIKGGNPKGKNVLLISGVHGDEATPIYTLMLMLKNPKSINTTNIKSLTILNGFNQNGILAHNRNMSFKPSTDLNRSLELKDFDYVLELKKYIEENDVIIDIHSSPACSEFALIDIDEYTTSLKKWCDLSNVPTAFRYSSANTIKRYSLLNNKIALTLEINKLNEIDIDSANKTIPLINNLLINVNNIKLKKTIPKVSEVLLIKSYLNGIFISKKLNNLNIKKNEILGEIFDYSGEKIYTLKAPCDGDIITFPNDTLVSRGETLYYFQPKKN